MAQSAIVYNGEKHQRGKLWYVIFAAIVVLLIVFSLLYGNYSGVVLLFFLVGGYLFYQLLHLQQFAMVAQEDGIYIDKTHYPWSSLQGFVIEVDRQTGQAKNIVLVGAKTSTIYSFADSMENVKELVYAINEKISLLDVFPQTFSQRLMRMIKL